MKNAIEWWTSEISNMIPDSVRFFFLGLPSARNLRFSPDANVVKKKGRNLIAPSSLLSVDSNTQSVTLSKPVVVDAVLPKDQCLKRQISLPEMNRKNLLQAIALDTEVATPFRNDEILWSITESSDNGQNSIQQFIYRRSDALALQARLKTHGLVLRQLVVAGCEDTPLLDFSNELVRPYSFWRRINVVLLIAIIGISAALIWKPIAAKIEVLEGLHGEVSLLTSTAFQLRQELTTIESAQEEKAAFLTALSDQVLLIDVLRELTVLLPDTVWLSNIQYNENGLILTGTVEGSAAELILGISQSRKLINPRLSGQVSRGRVPGTESFAITTSVRQGGI